MHSNAASYSAIHLQCDRNKMVTLMSNRQLSNIKQKLKMAIVVPSLCVVSLSGCSTINDSANTVGESVVWLAEGTTKLTTDVKVDKVDDKNFILQQTFNEPVKTLDSWALRIEARELCPEGYIYTNRNAFRDAAFGEANNECLANSRCQYQLQWRIKCQQVPQEPFSLFGKT